MKQRLQNILILTAGIVVVELLPMEPISKLVLQLVGMVAVVLMLLQSYEGNPGVEAMREGR